jgi:hypothetical protein
MVETCGKDGISTNPNFFPNIIKQVKEILEDWKRD